MSLLSSTPRWLGGLVFGVVMAAAVRHGIAQQLPR